MPTIKPSTQSLVSKPPVNTQSKATSPEAREQEAARARLTRMQEDIAHTQQEMENQLDYIRDNYQTQTMDQELRQEAALDQQQLKGYEKLRDIQKQQAKELARVQKQGETQLQETKHYYENAITSTDKKGQADLLKLQTKYVQQIENDKTVNDAWLSETRNQQASHFERSRGDREAKLQQATEAYQKEFERVRQTSAQASVEAEGQFTQKVADTMKRQSEVLDSIYSRGGELLKEVREDTSRKLVAYQSRQEDPFYQMLDLKASLEDDGENFVLRALIPEHEQGGISVTVKGSSQLMLSGTRRSEEKLKLEPGRTKGTSSYQSFSETFPLSAPVDSRLLTKVFEGNELIVTVPKQATTFARPPYKGPKPEKVRVERPQFPENIPDGKTTQVARKPNRGSRPLG